MVSYKLKYEHPHFPPGTLFSVGGLGRVKNGESLEIDDDMERNFIAARGMAVETAFANDHAVELTGNSALDADELAALLEAYAPVPVLEEVPASNISTVDETGQTEQETPAWLAESTGGDTNA